MLIVRCVRYATASGRRDCDVTHPDGVCDCNGNQLDAAGFAVELALWTPMLTASVMTWTTVLAK